MIKKWTILLALIAFSTTAFADEKAKLTKQLHDFLAGQTAEHHQAFWADDLIYTSSNGTRFGKDAIMAGFKDSPETEEAKTEEKPTIRYSGVDVDVRVYGDIAVVAFKLIMKENDEIKQTYFNTGTFQKREQGWQAIAWQATKIPKPE